MPENPQTRKNVTADWLVQGVLTKIGDTFDRLLGRGWKPSSSLATSELIERLKKLLDNEVRENGDLRKYVPHNIKLKMQWDKFSTDSGESLKKLENELLTAVVDHINDRRYYTYAPLMLEVKPDYFTSGVRLQVSFDKFEEDHEAEAAIPLTVATQPEKTAEPVRERLQQEVFARFSAAGEPKTKRLLFEEGRRLSVGRTKENDLAIDDPSVSKFHASLMLSAEGSLVVADTGSTNGTYVNGERIAYGKAIIVGSNDRLKFGLIDVELEILPKAVEEQPSKELPKTETYSVGEFEFTKRIETAESADERELPKTQPSLPAPTEPSFELDTANENETAR